MKIRYLLISLASLFFMLTAWHLPAAHGADQVDVIVDRGVNREAESLSRMAIEATMDFFNNTYGLTLERKLEIFLVADQQTHIKELRQRYSMPGSMASHTAGNFGGIAGGEVIIVNTNQSGGKQSYMATVCHELVHIFQNQASQGSRYGSIKWMTEGVAQALAAQIMMATGVPGAGEAQKHWPELLQRAGQTPRLEYLRTYKDWDDAGRTFGYPVVYTTAAVAVLNLVQEKGSKPLFSYFRKLSQAEPETAFYQAFGVKLSEFEKSFRPY